MQRGTDDIRKRLHNAMLFAVDLSLYGDTREAVEEQLYIYNIYGEKQWKERDCDQEEDLYSGLYRETFSGKRYCVSPLLSEM